MREIIFESVQLRNFKSFEDAEFSFEPNRFVAVCGSNGRGKTTLLADSVMWALYDETTKGRTGDSVVRKRAKKDCHVFLKFRIGDDHYEIRKYYKDKTHSNNKYLYKNNNPISETTRLTNKTIENILMPKMVFQNCLLFSQFVDKPFTEKTHSKQKDVIDSMLQLDQYDEYRERIKDTSKQCESNSEKLKSNMMSIQSIIDTHKQSIVAEQEKERETIGKYDNQIAQIRIGLAQFKLPDNAESQDELADKLKIVHEQKGIISATITQKQQSISTEQTSIQNECRMLYTARSVVVNDKYVNQLQEMTASRVKCATELSGIDSTENSEIATITNKKYEYEKELAVKFDPDSKRLNNELSSYSVEKSNANSQKSILASNKQTLISQHNNIESKLNEPTSVCYACGQDVGAKEKEKIRNDLIGIKNQITELDKQISANSVLLIDIDAKMETTTNEIERILQARSAHSDEINIKYNNAVQNVRRKYRDKKTSLKDEIANLDAAIQQIKRDCDGELKIEHEKIQAYGKQKYNDYVNSVNIEIERLNADIAMKNDEIANINAILSVYTDIDKRNDKIAEIETLKSAISKSASDRIASINKNIADKMDEGRAAYASYKENDRTSNILSFWKSAFSDTGIKSVILDESIPILNEKARELSNRTNNIRIKFDSQSQLKTGELRNKFAVNVIQTENLTDDRRDFSAGEGKMVDIITLLCLRHLLESTHDVKFNIMLMDEVLENLDIENAQTVINFLIPMAKEYCICFISHTLRDMIEADEYLTL